MSRKQLNKQQKISVSQNFLTSGRTIRRIIKLAKMSKDDYVVEIGPGKGHITRQLLSACRHVTAVEIDKMLYSRLTQTFSHEENLRLVQHDFLKWKLPSKPFKVFANLPFNCTSSILKKLTSCSRFMGGCVIVEKGAAKRFMGKPYESKNSLLLKPNYEFKILYHFKREDFHPAPSVDCVLLQIKRKQNPDICSGEYSAYHRFIEKCFDNRVGIHKLLTKRQIAAALKKEGLSCDKPSANMLYVQWLCLFRYSRRLPHGLTPSGW